MSTARGYPAEVTRLRWLHWLDASVAIRLTFLILALFVAEISDTLIEVLPWLALITMVELVITTLGVETRQHQKRRQLWCLPHRRRPG